MAFAAAPGEFGRHYGDSHIAHLSKVPESPLYGPSYGRNVGNETPYYSPSAGHASTEIDLNYKMGGLELAAQPSNTNIVLPGQRQVKELVQVIEAAESAIRNQMQENEQLRTVLRVTEWELQNSKMENQGATRRRDNHMHENYQHMQASQAPAVLPSADRQGLVPANGHSGSNEGNVGLGLGEEQQGSMVLHSGLPKQLDVGLNGPSGDGPNIGANGVPKGQRGGHPHMPPFVETSSTSAPSSRSMSPANHGRRRETEFEVRPQTGTQGLGQHPLDVNAKNGYQQQVEVSGYQQKELALRSSRMLEEEILQLRSRLVESSIKEAQMLSEKRILERRVAELRLAYDQQQQGLVDAASKALSYRQDVLEENIRLTYALQAAEQERSVYVTSLMPLLAEFDLQPTVTDAHSMVSAVKILVQHLRSELSLSEGYTSLGIVGKPLSSGVLPSLGSLSA